MTKFKRLWLILGILIFLSPLGLFLPEWMATETPWGEWSPEKLEELVGFLPEGVRKLSDFWKPFFSNYSLGAGQTGSYLSSGFRYMLSALLGAVLVTGVSFLVAKIVISKRERKRE